MEKEKKAFYDLAEIKAIPLQEICKALEIFHSARTGAKL